MAISGQRVFRPLITSGKFKGIPKCIEKGCNNPGQHTGNYRVDGSISYRKRCHKHHNKHTAKKYGLPSISHVMAKKAGFDDINDYLNSKHEYRCNRKTYCENIDGRLGFACTTTIADKAMLEVDHINNNHRDHRKVNNQTLCACCHRYKTKHFGHIKTLSWVWTLFDDNIRKFSKKRKK